MIDSTGIYSLKNLRPLDRGSDELDRGRYEKHEYVMWGATGAAAHRREMIEDVSLLSRSRLGEFSCVDWNVHLNVFNRDR